MLFAFGGLTVGSSGFFAVAGPMTFIAFLALMVRVLTTSFVLWRAPARELPDTLSPARA